VFKESFGVLPFDVRDGNVDDPQHFTSPKNISHIACKLKVAAAKQFSYRLARGTFF
jgi:hypothetical protein